MADPEELRQEEAGDFGRGGDGMNREVRGVGVRGLALPYVA